MNIKYVNIFIIICFIISSIMIVSACNIKKKTKIIINHESKYSKMLKQKKDDNTSNNIINLGDEKQINYNFDLGPEDIKNPDFNIININMP